MIFFDRKFYSNFIRVTLPCWFVVLIAISAPANANKPDNITDAEMLLIPKYCPDTMGFNYGDSSFNTSPRANRWVSLMGKDFWNVHHYCWAQINRMRAMRSGVRPEARKGTFESVRADYLYVITKAHKDFILLPEILTRLGEVELLLSNPNGADVAFARAREIKVDYWPAYSGWVEYLMKLGKRSVAKALVKEGLEYSPNAKVLLEQYRLLGGKASEIIPKRIVDETPDQVPPTSAESATSENIPPEQVKALAPVGKNPGD